MNRPLMPLLFSSLCRDDHGESNGFRSIPMANRRTVDGESSENRRRRHELHRRAKMVFDLHHHHIDQITIPCTRGVLRRVEDVFDCWFESGSMPYAYIPYPFENKELFEKKFPGDFVAEGLDQTRGCMG